MKWPGRDKTEQFTVVNTAPTPVSPPSCEYTCRLFPVCSDKREVCWINSAITYEPEEINERPVFVHQESGANKWEEPQKHKWAHIFCGFVNKPSEK